MTKTTPAVNKTTEAVTNIGELFHALAVGWAEGKRNRFIIAGDGGQFIRTPQSHMPKGRHVDWYRPWVLDIPIETSYRMTGFITFDSESMFRGMFHRKRGDQQVYVTAELTKEGFEYALKGVIDIDLSNDHLRRIKFFNPDSRDVTQSRLPSPDLPAILIDHAPTGDI